MLGEMKNTSRIPRLHILLAVKLESIVETLYILSY